MTTSSTAKLIAVPREIARQIAPEFASLAKRSNGRVTVATLERDIVDGGLRVWAIADGPETLAWLLTSTYRAPTGVQVFRIEAIVGRGRKRWLHLMQELVGHARAMGCSLVECNARPGWRDEIPGLKHSANFLEATL